MICVRCIVSGRVQGVWYRGSTQREAERLGIVGHARNRANGDVEVLACGQSQAVEQLKAWLWRGPVAAEVTDVVCEVVQCVAPDDFTTG